MINPINGSQSSSYVDSLRKNAEKEPDSVPQGELTQEDFFYSNDKAIGDARPFESDR